MISKKLMSEVFTDGQLSFRDIETDKNIVTYEYLQESYIGEDEHYFWKKESINIYELAHKCKEWAYKQFGNKQYSYGYLDRIFSGITDNGYECIIYYTGDAGEYFKADTEPEAIFEACQWILENK